MIIHKDISIDGYKFDLNYNDKNTELDLIDNINCHNLIMVTFTPKKRMTETEGNSILDNYRVHFLNHIHKILIANNDFYRNFKISYDFSGRGCSLAREFKQQILLKMEIHFNIKLKDKSSQT